MQNSDATDNIQILHAPEWRLCGREWHLIVGNRSVARLVPNFDLKHRHYRWLSALEFPEFDDHGWHAVDFETLESAQHDIEQWWAHLCRGEVFVP